MSEKHDVTIYTTPTCVYCRMAKQYFQDHQVAYREVDVAADQLEAQKMVEKSGQLGVPVIEIDGRIVVGFDQGRIAQLLGL